jgi:hypothetical protein
VLYGMSVFPKKNNGGCNEAGKNKANHKDEAATN